MNQPVDTDTELHNALGQLRGPLEPARDLWPDISERLEPRASDASLSAPRKTAGRWQWQALAASITVAFLAGLLLGRGGEAPPAPLETTTAAQWAVPSLAVALKASELEYQAAFKGFQPIDAQSSLLESQAMADIAGSWDDLQQAEQALVAALKLHPDNAYLAQKLLDLRSQQLEFMRQLHMLDQNSRRTT